MAHFFGLAVIEGEAVGVPSLCARQYRRIISPVFDEIILQKCLAAMRLRYN